MPMDRSRYPDDWDEISARIRFERAKNHCEWCGVENRATILRSADDGSRYLVLGEDGIHYTADGEPLRMSEIPDEFLRQERYTKVVLTVAHLGVDHPDGTPGDKHDVRNVRDENLAALCQRCHLLEDMDDHIANRKQTMLRRKRAQRREEGQLEIWPEW